MPYLNTSEGTGGIIEPFAGEINIVGEVNRCTGFHEFSNRVWVPGARSQRLRIKRLVIVMPCGGELADNIQLGVAREIGRIDHLQMGDSYGDIQGSPQLLARGFDGIEYASG